MKDKNINYTCMHRSHWSHKWQSALSILYIKSTVSCFFINCQGPVVPHAPCQKDRDATPELLLGAESLTPVTQGTGWLQVVLVEHVSQMANGQGVIQLVHVSPHYVILISFTYWLQACKIIPNSLADLKYVKMYSRRYTILFNSVFIPFQMHLIRIIIEDMIRVHRCVRYDEKR